MDLIKLIKERRSIRTYEDKELPDDVLNQVLEAVRWSPSWANTQCWEIVVVKDKEIREKLKGTIAPKNPATKAVVSSSVLIALCAKLGASGYYNDKVTTKFGDWFMFDLGIATQTICLAAHNLGIGTVVIGLFDHDKAGEILNVPKGYELVSLIPLGYPAKESSAPKRQEPAEFTHYDKF